MSISHTLGSWNLDGPDENGAVFVRDANGKLIYNTRRRQAYDCARLISAAPDLLVALEALVDRISAFNEQTACNPEMTAARAAIARATGE